MRRALAALALVLASWSAGARPVAPDVPLALAALRVATLAEHVAKLHVQSSHGILPERGRRALKSAVRELDAQVKVVRARAAAPEVREASLLLAILWDEQRGWALRPPARENARRLVERTEETAWVAEKAGRLAAAGSDAPALLAQRAAMLSQRVTRLHLMARGPDDVLGRLAAEQELRRAIAGLADAPGHTPATLAELELARNQLEFVAPAPVARAGTAREGASRRLEFTAKAGDHLLESMSRLVRLYGDF